MAPYVEFAAGAATFILGLAAIVLALRFGSAATRTFVLLAIAVEVLIIASIFLDWGYSWYNRIALDIALNSNIWIAFPHGIALLILMLVGIWGLRTAAWLVALAVVQSLSFILIIFFVETDIDASLLAPVPLVSMYLSVLAAFWLLPQAISLIPKEGSRWFLIAFGPRTDLIQSIQALAKNGFSVSPPKNLLESGQASGFIGSVTVEVATRLSILPPAYALRARWIWPDDPGHLVIHPPGFTRREKIIQRGRILEYIGLSGSRFHLSPSHLWNFLSSVSRLPPCESNDQHDSIAKES